MDIKRKLTSRKFWAAVCNFVGQLLILMNYAEDTVVKVTALIMAGAGVIAYIIGEGLADASGSNEVFVPEDDITDYLTEEEYTEVGAE